jgi:hypothetical protein
MTEHDWLHETRAERLLSPLWRHSKQRLTTPFVLPISRCRRLVRLVACGCCRLVWERFSDPLAQSAVEVAEAVADRQIHVNALKATREALSDAFGQISPWDSQHVGVSLAREAVAQRTRVLESALRIGAETINSLARLRLRLPPIGPPYQDQIGREKWHATRAEANVAVLEVIRDIFGNPFQPSPKISERVLAWGDGVVPALARGIYEDRAFDRLPILADALQDAGCDNEAILAHLHSPGPHVRGCWAVDLILGKS